MNTHNHRQPNTRQTRMVVHNQHAASVNRYTVDCATGKVTPATVNHVTVVTVPGRHHRADALKLATVALGLCDKRGGGVIPLVVHVTKSDHVFRVDYDCKALAFINPN